MKTSFSEELVNDGLEVFGVKACFEVGVFEGVEVLRNVRPWVGLLEDDVSSGLKWREKCLQRAS